VSSLDDSGVGTLRAAISQADTGNSYVIKFAVKGTIDLTSALPALDNNIVIKGPGASNLTVQRDSRPSTPLFSVFTVDSGVTVSLSGMTIAGGNAGVDGYGGGISAYDGGGIFNAGTVTVTSSIFINNSGLGGGIYNDSGGIVTVRDSSFTSNSASHGGGIFNGGTATVSSSSFTSNSANTEGGGIDNLGMLKVVGST